MQINCPICKKGGLSDYTVQPTICPQCNSDLTPYMLLHSLSKLGNRRISLFFIIIIGVLVCALAFLYFTSINESQKLIDQYSRSVSQLRDTINKMNVNNAITSRDKYVSNNSSKEIIFQYKVRKGDYLSKLAELFYNDWRMYIKIEQDNNLHRPYILKIGQPIIIKLAQE